MIAAIRSRCCSSSSGGSTLSTESCSPLIRCEIIEWSCSSCRNVSRSSGYSAAIAGNSVRSSPSWCPLSAVQNPWQNNSRSRVGGCAGPALAQGGPSDP